jgi:phage terminase small subunit
LPNARAAAPKTIGTRPKARARSVAAARQGQDTTTKAGAALVSADKPLTDQQRLFVKFWAQGESPMSASVKAGYSDGGTFAYRMIYMPNILAAYRLEKEAYEAASGMNRKRVIEGFIEAIEMAKVMADPGVMVAGWREVGKMCGYYEPTKVNVNVNHTGQIAMERLDKMSDAELIEFMRKQTEAIALESGAPQLPGEAHEDDADGSAAP